MSIEIKHRRKPWQLGKPNKTVEGPLVPISVHDVPRLGAPVCDYCAIEFDSDACKKTSCRMVVFLTPVNFITFQLTGAVPKAR